MKNMLRGNQEEMNKNWQNKNAHRENIRIMGMDSKQQVEIFLKNYLNKLVRGN